MPEAPVADRALVERRQQPASIRSTDAPITVVWSSSTVPAGRSTPSSSGTPGSRVATITGSTVTSSVGRISCSQASNGSASSSRNVQVSWTIVAGRS